MLYSVGPTTLCCVVPRIIGVEALAARLWSTGPDVRGGRAAVVKLGSRDSAVTRGNGLTPLSRSTAASDGKLVIARSTAASDGKLVIEVSFDVRNGKEGYQTNF